MKPRLFIELSRSTAPCSRTVAFKETRRVYSAVNPENPENGPFENGFNYLWKTRKPLLQMQPVEVSFG
jgi:hypothetical protein